MKNFYDYTFFQIQQSLLRSKNYTPVGTAILLLSGLECFNIMTLIVLFKIETLKSLGSNYQYPLSLYLLICLINTLYFVINKKYKFIIDNYLLDSEDKRKKGWKYVLFYMISTIILLFVVVIIMSNLRGYK